MTAGLLYVPITGPCINNAFQPVSGATLQINITGSGAANLFADAALSTSIANPQTSNASGRFFAQSTTIFVDASQGYDAILTFPDGETFTFTDLPVIAQGISTAGLAPLNSPLFTGNPRGPTPALNDSSASLATTAFVAGQGFAVLNSPALTGTPTAPTASPGTNTTQLATTAFVEAALGVRLPTSTTQDYFKIGGIYLQYTPYSLSSTPLSTQAVTWPIAFPTALAGEPWIAPNGGAVQMIGTTSASTTGCTVQKGNENFARTGTVFAIGY